MRFGYYDEDGSEYYQMLAEETANRIYRKKLAAHPDCRDPDHPGCVHCEELEDENENFTA